MPIRSAAQYGLMQGAAHDPSFAQRVGVPQKVARKFVDETPQAKRHKLAMAMMRRNKKK